jgi:hypothetical protein
MIRGLRASDASDLRQRTNGDMRLLLRIGALLEQRVSFTALALDRLLADEAGRKLLIDRNLATAFAEAAAAAGIDDLRLLTEADGAEAGWRTVALTDEVGNPLSAMIAEQPAEPGMSGLVGSLAPALRAPVEGFLQARADDQRAAALERLRYAAPPLSVVGELMPMLLSDSAELVRERAIALVSAAGGHTLIIDLVRAMQRRDDATLARLAPSLRALPPEQQDLAISAAVAHAARGEASQGLIDVCTALAPALAAHRQTERLLELLLPTAFSLVELVRALQIHDAARIAAVLQRSLGFGPAQDARVIILLAAPGVALDAAILERGIGLLLEVGEEPRQRMALAAALRRVDGGRTLATRIAAQGMRICQAHDTSVHWLLAELCRDGAVDPASAIELAGTLRHLLREAPGPHLISVLEQQLPVLLPIPAAERAALADPLIEISARFRADRSIDLITTALIGLGADALGPVWDGLEHHPMDHVRLLLIGLIADLIAQAPDQGAAAAYRLLAGLERAEQGGERGALVAAAARIAGQGALSADATLAHAVDAATVGLGRYAYEALGHLAAGAGCTPERRAAIVDQLIMEACAELPDTPSTTTTDAATGELTYQLDERLAAHTEHVPRILAALARIGRSPHCQPEVQRRMIERLVAQWKRVASWSLIWGPGNVHELALTLSLLGSDATCPGPLRVRIVEALTPQVDQLQVARALARILMVGEGPYLARLAGRAAEELVKLAARDNEFAEDERAELVEVLADFLAVPALGPDADTVRRRLVGVIATLREHASSRARARLRYLAGELPRDLAARLDWA